MENSIDHKQQSDNRYASYQLLLLSDEIRSVSTACENLVFEIIGRMYLLRGRMKNIFSKPPFATWVYDSSTIKSELDRIQSYYPSSKLTLEQWTDKQKQYLLSFHPSLNKQQKSYLGILHNLLDSTCEVLALSTKIQFYQVKKANTSLSNKDKELLREFENQFESSLEYFVEFRKLQFSEWCSVFPLELRKQLYSERPTKPM